MENRIRIINSNTMNIIMRAKDVEPGRYITISLRRGCLPKIMACDTTSGKAVVRKTDSISYAWEWLLSSREKFMADSVDEQDSLRLLRRKQWAHMTAEEKRLERTKQMNDIARQDPTVSMTFRDLLEDITSYAVQMGREYPDPGQMVQDYMEYDGLPAVLAIVMAGRRVGYWQVQDTETSEARGERGVKE